MMHFRSLSYSCDRERGRGYETVQARFQAGMRAQGITGENSIEVTKSMRWKIRIRSKCPQDMSQAVGRSA